MRIELISSLGRVDPAAWDALAGDDDPFVEHAFLRALEESGSVGSGTGWEPLHVTVHDGERLVGALPLYLKEHSYGEYIFDWGWADAAMRLGVRYYPKLVSMVPCTPATGRRLLVHPDADRRVVIDAIARGCFEAVEATDASSLHVLFLTEEERDELGREERLHPRLSQQFHWQNEGWQSFDDYLGSFRASLRKQVRKERREVAASGLQLRMMEGCELRPRDWDAVYAFYRRTCMLHGGYPYLTRELFRASPSPLARRAVVSFALERDRPVAAALHFEKGNSLYGRYWGARQDHALLHFELCYYQPIERAIAKGMARFEAGAQGIHKLRRGLMPRAIHSLHWIRDRRLGAAVDEFLAREARAVARQIDELSEHGPFRRGPR